MQRTNDPGMLGPDYDIYVTPLLFQGLGSIMREQQKNFKSQRMGRTAAKQYLLDMTQQVSHELTSTVLTCTGLGPSTFHHRKGKGLRDAPTSGGAIDRESYRRWYIMFCSGIATDQLPILQQTTLTGLMKEILLKPWEWHTQKQEEICQEAGSFQWESGDEPEARSRKLKFTL